MFAGLVESFQPRSYFYVIRSDSLLNAPPIGIRPVGKEIPENFELYQNFPNPFNSSTTIKFDINQSSPVQLMIFDVAGRLIKTLVNSVLKHGVYTTKWEGADFPSGVYLCALYLGYKLFQTKKMVLLK